MYHNGDSSHYFLSLVLMHGVLAQDTPNDYARQQWHCTRVMEAKLVNKTASHSCGKVVSTFG